MYKDTKDQNPSSEPKLLDKSVSDLFQPAIDNLKNIFKKKTITMTSLMDEEGNIDIFIGDKKAKITKNMLNQEDADGNSIFLLTLMTIEPPTNAGRQWHYPDNSAQENLFEQLLSLGVTPELLNHQNKKGMSALHYAAGLNNTKLTKLLLDNKADPNIATKGGYTPISLTLDYPIEIKTLLLDGGADPNVRCAHGTLLHFAAKITDLDLAKQLLAKGADINATDDNNDTPLHLHCSRYESSTSMTNSYLGSKYSIIEFTKLFLEYKPSTEILNKQNQTAIDVAKASENTDLLNLLVIKEEVSESKKVEEKDAKSESQDSSLHESMSKDDTTQGEKLTLENPTIAAPVTALDITKPDNPLKTELTTTSEEKQAENEKPHKVQEDDSYEANKDKKQLTDSTEKTESINFYQKLCAQKSTSELINYMDWKAYPKVNSKNLDSFKLSDLYTKKVNYIQLSQNPEIEKSIFNLSVYSSMLPKNGTKQKALYTLLEKLSDKSPEEAEKLIQAALKNEALIKNTGFGFYKFFHSGPKHIRNHEMQDRWARSTTEELLIALYDAMKKSVEEKLSLEVKSQ